MKKFYYCLLFIVFANWLTAQVPANYRFVKTWRISDRFAVADSIPVDTIPLNYQISNPIDRFSISNSYNGNLGSPIQSKIYFDRPANADFIFATAYFPYIVNVQSATFYNTKTPYSNLDYNTGGSLQRDEDHIKFLFTFNANKKLNFGTTLDYTAAPGEYGNQATERFSGSLFGTYQGKHYSATGHISTNSLRNQENGGITNPTDINSTFAPKDIPVNMQAQSGYSQGMIYYNQQYSIGFERSVKVKKDSVRMDYVPVTRFSHTLKYVDESKRYVEEPAVKKPFYTNTYLPFVNTKDTSGLKTLTNTFSIKLEEEFNKLLNFGLTAFLENEIQNYTFKNDSVISKMLNSTTKVGAILSKEQGKRFKYNFEGELSLVGYKAGEFKLNGNIGGFFKLWKDSISLVANGFIRSDKPSYFLQHYNSNHFRWDNNFENTYRTHVGGTFSIPTRSFSLNVAVENVTKYVFFDSIALPAQFSGNIQILSANLKQDFHVGRFTLENNVVFQVSSQPGILPLPRFTFFENLYYHDLWFKVLSIQLGANVRYHTEYYAPTYMPATGQFYTQTKTQIGNYPVVTAYLNMHLKRTRFFVEYYHINQMFMNGPYFSMPNYPINEANMKLGVSWNFYD